MSLGRRIQRAKRWVRDLLYGMFYHQLYMDSIKYASDYRDLLLFIMYGDLLGVPLFTNTLTLRLLPYVLKEVYGWKPRMLRERDVTDEVPEVG